MSRAVPPFRTTTWSSYNQALKRCGLLMVWLDPGMSWFAAPNGWPGHPERFSAAIQFCVLIEVLIRLPLRPTTGFVERPWPCPGSTGPCRMTPLCRRQKHPGVQIPYLAASRPLHLLMDSPEPSPAAKASGRSPGKQAPGLISGPAHSRKHGTNRRRQWRKVNICIDTETLAVRGVEVTSTRLGDAERANATGPREPANVLPDLLAQIPADERIDSVTSDGLYDTKGCILWPDG